MISSTENICIIEHLREVEKWVLFFKCMIAPVKLKFTDGLMRKQNEAFNFNPEETDEEVLI